MLLEHRTLEACPRWKSSCSALPRVFTIGLGWPDDNPPKGMIAAFMEIPPKDGLYVREFYAVADLSVAAGPDDGEHTHRLDGFITYYGKHYFAYWRRGGGEAWVSFDDKKVGLVGSWDQAVAEICASKMMPLLLFFGELAAVRRDGP
jgi:hypothetical protein